MMLRLALLVLPFAADAVKEFVAMVPAAADAHETKPTVEWVQLDYAADVSDAKDVRMAVVNDTDGSNEIGAWRHLDLSVGGGSGAMLSAKVVDDKMYVLVEKVATEGAGGGCCADTLRVYDQADGSADEVDLNALNKGLFAPDNVSWAYATHTFDVFKGDDGKVYALLQVQYEDPHVAGAKVNSIVKLDVQAKAAVPTKDGDAYWSIETRLGEETFDYNASVYKLQYVNGTGTEEWHGNGVLRFADKAGNELLALTHRFYEEAFVVKDPWTYAKADGADAILQRFGTSPFRSGDDDELSFDVDGKPSAVFHRFGLPATARQWTGGVHNVWYTAASKTKAGGLEGKETITLFVNSIQGRATSFVFEFELKLVPEDPKVPASDDVFGGVAFTWAQCGFKAQAMGGARVIGDGVYLVASGGGSGGQFEVVTAGDTNNTKISVVYPGDTAAATNLYDTYARVVVEA